jgi:hypothetical protein
MFRVVGATEEGASVRGQEARHRPSALAVHGDGGVHVHGIQVRTFFPVHLDADEAGIHEGGHLVILERLVSHHVTPVAGCVADRQQDRHIARLRLLQCF